MTVKLSPDDTVFAPPENVPALNSVPVVLSIAEVPLMFRKQPSTVAPEPDVMAKV